LAGCICVYTAWTLREATNWSDALYPFGINLKKNKQFSDKEWFLNFFDQIKYFPVSESELEQWRADFENGQTQIQIEDTEFDYAAYLQLLEDEKDSIAEFRAQQQHAFSAEVGLWKESVDHQEHLVAEAPDETDYSAYAALHASMTGNIWKILVEQGQIVKKGETIAIIEAMKMELPVYAADDGTVKAIICRAGQTVHSGEPLVYME